MLLSVHGAVVGGDPNCNMDAWADNHYAVDATHDYDFVHDWLRANPSQPYVCQGENVHFVFDPTGWAVQLNVNFTEPGPSCDARSDDGWTSNLRAGVLGARRRVKKAGALTSRRT
jgi:hypothetical protein